MATVPLATLDTDGYVKDPARIAARLFSYYFKSDYSQSDNYRGGVKSLPYTIAKNPQNIDQITSDIQRNLEQLFSAQFDNVAVVTSYNIVQDATTGEETAKYNVSVAVTFEHNGAQKQVNRLLEIVNNEFVAKEEAVV